MKTFLRSLSFLLTALLLPMVAPTQSAQADTNLVSCIYSAADWYSSSSTAQGFTNPITIQPWPTSIVGIVATNYVPGPAMTFYPNTNGVVQTFLYPNQYRLTWSGLPQSVIFSVYPSTNVLNLSQLPSTGAGVYWYTNNANYLVLGSPGDTQPGTLTGKIGAGTSIYLTTNNVGGSLQAVINVNLSNNWSGTFTGTGVALTQLQATNVQPNTGALDSSLMPGNLWYLNNYLSSIFPTNLAYGPSTNIPGNSWPAVILGGTNNGINVAAGNTAILSGIGCNIYSGASNSIIAGGSQNLAAGYAANTFIVGGTNNTTSYNTQPPAWGGIIGGMRNWQYGPSSVILGGSNNYCLGGQSIIAGGQKNYIQVGGFNSWAGGSGAMIAYPSCWVWADWPGTNVTFQATGTNQYLIRAIGGVGINTNNPGTNSLEVWGNADFQSASIQGTNMFTLFNPAAASNNLSILFNAALASQSNYFSLYCLTNAQGIVAATNQITVTSNSLAASLLNTSNTLAASILSVSNLVGATKRFTLTVPSGYASIGASFSAPFMPDGNYSISVCPQDATTAGAMSAGGGEFYYPSSKANNGFTLNILFATNVNLTFDITVGENTQ